MIFRSGCGRTLLIDSFPPFQRSTHISRRGSQEQRPQKRRPHLPSIWFTPQEVDEFAASGVFLTTVDSAISPDIFSHPEGVPLALCPGKDIVLSTISSASLGAWAVPRLTRTPFWKRPALDPHDPKEKIAVQAACQEGSN